ncbi:MAG: hypothetical protein N2316_05420 [Spirochaetes bacterium]|nr:hypothetical protein [Spirochaetota bacterium]
MIKRSVALIVGALVIGCSAVREGEIKKIASQQTHKKNDALLLNIKQQNDQMPKVYRAQFVIDGVFPKKKKFKAMGTIACDIDAGLMKITFVDSVFKSTIALVVQEKEKIKIFMPAEKTLFEDDIRFINVKNYIDVNLNVKILSEVIRWRVPFIDNFIIASAVFPNTGKTKFQDEKFIVLENDLFFETISLTNGIANRIMITDKNNKEKIEFYFENLQKKEGALYFDTIRYVSPHRGERMVARFFDVATNVQFLPQKEFSFNIPKNVKVIKVN